MNKYKDQSSLLMMPDPNDERLGAVLARGLTAAAGFEPGQCTEFSECPAAEEIAALVEGAAPAKEKDRLFKHISACADCYESFMLTMESHKKVEEERKEDKHKIIFLRPLALAASVLIVVFTAYFLFRTGGIPKTLGDLPEKSEALNESSERLRQPVEMPFQDKSKVVTETDTRRISMDREAAQKEDKKRKLSSPRPAPPAAPAPVATSRVEESRKEEFKAQEKPKDAELEADKLEMTAKPAKGGTSQPIARSAAEKSEIVDDEAGKNRLDGYAGQKDIPYQQQAVILNQQVQQINTYVPQKELNNLFNQTVYLSQQMLKEVQLLNKEAVANRDFDKINSYVEEVKPLIKVTVEADTVYIFPDIEWFLSRSDPGSVEYRFFSLARSGWCVADDLCTTGKLSGPETQKLLAQWQELEPQLTGTFKQIAARTISHLAVGNQEPFREKVPGPPKASN
ncbi:MAG: hypothetical protein QG657_1645 [Acidobacteriota bacterium]|nr:hypothetical protein [Acidobacteriota bacterium]